MTIGDKKRQIIITVNRNKNSTGNYYPYDKYNLDEKKKKKKISTTNFNDIQKNIYMKLKNNKLQQYVNKSSVVIFII